MGGQLNIAAVVLAGGRSSRMGGVFKGALPIGDRSLLGRVIDAVEPQVSRVLLNLNNPPETLGLAEDVLANAEIVPDLVPGFAGPLVGLVSAFEYLENCEAACDAVLVVPCDAPFLPGDLAARLSSELNAQGTDCACVSYCGVLQPTFSLWKMSCKEAAKEALECGEGGFKGLMARRTSALLPWPEQTPNPFFNANTPGELDDARGFLACDSDGCSQ